MPTLTTPLAKSLIYEVTSTTAGVLMSVDYVYDKLGRITQRTESLVGEPAKAFDYTYDLVGRLLSATEGPNSTTYTYSNNGNRRLSSTIGATTINVSGKYDTQDRLLTYGTLKIGYTKNGEEPYHR